MPFSEYRVIQTKLSSSVYDSDTNVPNRDNARTCNWIKTR